MKTNLDEEKFLFQFSVKAPEYQKHEKGPIVLLQIQPCSCSTSETNFAVSLFKDRIGLV